MKAPWLQSATSGFSLLRSVIKLGRIDEKQRLGIGAQSKSHDKMFSLSDDPPAQPQTTLRWSWVAQADKGGGKAGQSWGGGEGLDDEHDVSTGCPNKFVNKIKKTMLGGRIVRQNWPKVVHIGSKRLKLAQTAKIFWMDQSGPKI